MEAALLHDERNGWDLAGHRKRLGHGLAYQELANQQAIFSELAARMAIILAVIGCRPRSCS